MAPWLRVLEAYLVQALLRTPAFHRGVEKVARSVHRIRHGIPPEEMGGTKIDRPNSDGFLRHFNEEVQAQLGRAERRDNALTSTENHVTARKAGRANEATTQAEEENADAVWKSAQQRAAEPAKQGFMGEYMGALRDQLKSGK